MLTLLGEVVAWLVIAFVCAVCVAATWMNLSRPLPPRAPSDWERRLVRGERL